MSERGKEECGAGGVYMVVLTRPAPEQVENYIGVDDIYT